MIRKFYNILQPIAQILEIWFLNNQKIRFILDFKITNKMHIKYKHIISSTYAKLGLKIFYWWQLLFLKALQQLKRNKYKKCLKSTDVT